MKETKLLNCPFCGGEAVVEEHFKQWDGRYYEVTHISCRSCWCSSKTISEMECKDRKKRKEEAIKSWNTRKPMERILEKLNERIEHHVKLVNYEMNMGTIVDVERHEEAIKATDKAIEIVKEEGGIE